MDEEYKMGDAVLGRTTQEKDLGVTFSADMKVSEQCGIAASKGNQIEVFKIVNDYEDVDRNMFFKLKEGSRTRGHKAALVKEQCRLDMRKYSFSQRVINEWNKLPNDCVNASSVNMFKNRIYISDKGGLHIDEKIVGLSISQWRPCPLAIWNVLFGMAIL